MEDTTEEHVAELTARLFDASNEIKTLNKRIEQAIRVLQSRYNQACINAQDIMRVLSGNMYYYVTFSEKWRAQTHPRFADADPRGFVVIENASDIDEAKEVARQKFGKAYSQIVFEADWKFDNHSKGELMRIDAATIRRG